MDRQSYVAAHALLRLTAERTYHARLFHLRYAENGKPIVVQAGGHRLEVSLSHSRGFAAIGVTRDGLIGVDVESSRHHQAIEEMAFEALSVVEQAELAGVSGSERHEKFMTIWTLKESIVKATGQGLSTSSQSFTVSSSPLQLITTPDASNPLNWHLHTTTLRGGRLSVALKLEENIEPTIDVREFSDGIF